MALSITFMVLFIITIQPKTVANAAETIITAQTTPAVGRFFRELNDKVMLFNILTADVAWDYSVDPEDPSLPERASSLSLAKMHWRKNVCENLYQIPDYFLDSGKARQVYLLCRSPIFSDEETRKLGELLGDMQTVYESSQVCIPESAVDDDSNTEELILDFIKRTSESNNTDNLKKAVNIATDDYSLRDFMFENNFDRLTCFRGEPDLERLMAKSRNERVLRWAWLSWREMVGPQIRQSYPGMVKVMNSAAVRNGYADMGDSWREELEIKDLGQLVENLYNEIQPLYMKIHGIARFFLRRLYGDKVVPEFGPIPGHILGNMWAQNWETIVDVIMPEAKIYDLDLMIRKTGWGGFEMAKRAEDFYISLGLPAMTHTFWNKSVFSDDSLKSKTKIKCHGTAANMFRKGDFRMIYCAGNTMEDFYVIHHEMGHIQYYMAYEELPAIFKDGANSAFQESIGDAIMLGVLSPQHLRRLGLVKPFKTTHPKEGHFDYFTVLRANLEQLKKKTYDAEERLDHYLLLRQALTKLPHIPFALVIDKYRWENFGGKIDEAIMNERFWELTIKYQGVSPPNYTIRGEKYFDIAAKFHVPDNTPYIRYYLSSILQAQLFQGLCKASMMDSQPEVLEKRDFSEIPLHKCDIYGSKTAGNLLRNMMSKGSSITWSDALEIVTGEKDITSDALLRYFKPLDKYLDNIIKTYNIKLGW